MTSVDGAVLIARNVVVDLGVALSPMTFDHWTYYCGQEDLCGCVLLCMVLGSGSWHYAQELAQSSFVVLGPYYFWNLTVLPSLQRGLIQELVSCKAEPKA